jgi:N-methylhydantoinase A
VSAPDLLDVGVDVGGTFTDLVARAHGSAALRTRKVLTARDPSRALLEGLRALCLPGEEIASLTYGTTAVTNAVLEGQGARVALVTTRGFRDVLEIGRQQRDHLYRLDVPGRTPPAVPRALRFEVTERLDHRGRVLVPLDEAEVVRLAEVLRRAEVEAVAVCLLHAYANPAHERRVGALLGRSVPHVCLSSDVNPEFREYERTHTTCINAQLVPFVDRYLDDLTGGLARSGIRAPLRLMQSSGGMAAAGYLRRAPLAMLVSGPAGGVAAARALAVGAGVGDAVALDMGGTSTDVCLIRDGRVETLSERRVLGQPVRLRSLAVESIGAGGGSIAWLDRAGALRVGPHSAGADPGPACYGRGGAEPTVTDAYVVLGYLAPEREVGGLRLDPDGAWRAIEPLAGRLGLPVVDAAAGILEIANAAMHRAIRAVSVQRGIDPRRLVLIAYGGAGPMHAGRLAQISGMPRIVIPPLSSAFSAYGSLVAEMRYDAVRTIRLSITGGDPGAWEGHFREMEEDLTARTRDEGIPAGRAVLQRSMDLRYTGQNYEIEVPVEPGHSAAEIRQRFSEYHARYYDYATDEPVEVVNLRVAAIVPSEASGVAMPVGDDARETSGERRAFFYGSGWITVPVHPRSAVSAGREISGPANVEDRWSTLIVYPGQVLRCDHAGLLWIETTR